jgi:hypothetical protein
MSSFLTAPALAVVPGLLGGGGKALTILSTVLIADPGAYDKFTKLLPKASGY